MPINLLTSKRWDDKEKHFLLNESHKRKHNGEKHRSATEQLRQKGRFCRKQVKMGDRFAN